MATWPTADRVATHLNIPGNTYSTEAMAEATAAAVAEVAQFTIYNAADTEIPDDVRYATILLAAKLFNRKNTPDGTAGDSEFGIIRTNNFDGDVARLLAPHAALEGFA